MNLYSALLYIRLYSPYNMVAQANNTGTIISPWSLNRSDMARM